MVPAIAAAGVAVAATAVAAAVAAGAVVVGGGIVVREGGKLLLACGRELGQQAEENLAMQQRLVSAARRYDSDLRRGEIEEIARSIERSQARLQALQTTARRRNAAIVALLQGAGQEHVPAVDWAAAEIARAQEMRLPPTTKRMEPIEAWPERVREAVAQADRIERDLEDFVTGSRRGLFATAFWCQQVAEARTMLTKIEGPSKAHLAAVMLGERQPDIAGLAEVRAMLAAVAQRVAIMEATAPAQAVQRESALTALSQAQQAFDAAAGRAGSVNTIEGLEIASQTLDDAMKALECFEFVKVHTAAQAVLQHLVSLQDVVSLQRQRNLEHLLARLRAQVSPLAEVPLLANVAQDWLADCTACEQLAAQDIAAAWERVDGTGRLTDRANTLVRQAVEFVQQQAAQGVMDAAAETMQELGFRPDPGRRDAGASVHSLMGRQGEKRIHVSLCDSGEITVRIDGFGDQGCAAVQQRFFEGLRERGVISAWQGQFLLSDAVEDLVQTLWQSGLDVRVEPTGGGVTVLAQGKPNLLTTINYDGNLEVSADLERWWRTHVRTGESITLQDAQQEHQRKFYEHLQSIRLKERTC